MAPSAAIADEGGEREKTAIEQFLVEWVNTPMDKVLFYDLWAADNDEEHQIEIPFIVAWLILGASFFTLRYGLINVRGFAHAIKIVSGKYDDPDEPGQVSHFQALASALSATVGLGNIAGVAAAVHHGGPGAVFWMWVAAFLGMSTKFAECTLALMYRDVDADGEVWGGPMGYLSKGFREMGAGPVGKGLAVLFALLCVGGSFGGGNMFQANQARAGAALLWDGFNEEMMTWGFGAALAVLVGIVIIGGIERIGKVASFLVPAMCSLYLIAGIAILIKNAGQIPAGFATIFDEAFNGRAAGGGAIGVLVVGFQRAVFSNEAGVGSAAIAHSAASTSEPVREGMVAMLGPFIDTILVCTVAALVIVVSGVSDGQLSGIDLTAAAFETVIDGFPKVLGVAAFFFALSTIISWSYYGVKAWAYLFGHKSVIVYQLLYLGMVVVGAHADFSDVLAFSDLMILAMAVPNILGVVVLSPKIAEAMNDYWGRYRDGAFDR